MKTRIIITKPANFYASLCLIGLFLVVVTSFITVQFMKFTDIYVSAEYHQEVVQKLESEITYLKIVQTDIESEHEVVKENLMQEIRLRENVIGTLNSEIDKMVANVDYIASKYHYVLEHVTTKAVKNPITYSHLVKLDELCKEKDINPHMVLGLYNLESGFNYRAKNTKSTATGLGQFLAGTGKSIYDKFLNYDLVYDHATMASDPVINIELTVNYLSYLIDYHNGDVEKALVSYNGGELGLEYVNRINSYMIKNTSRGLTNSRYR